MNPTPVAELETKLASCEGRLKQAHEALTAANYGDVPAGWDAAIARAESAESALSLLTAKLAQCEEKLAKQERDILWVETRISCDDSGAEVLRQREQIERLTAAHAKALEDGKMMEEALKLCLCTLTDERIGKNSYMEGSEIYDDFDKAVSQARTALASAPATTGKGGEIS